MSHSYSAPAGGGTTVVPEGGRSRFESTGEELGLPTAKESWEGEGPADWYLRYQELNGRKVRRKVALQQEPGRPPIIIEPTDVPQVYTAETPVPPSVAAAAPPDDEEDDGTEPLTFAPSPPRPLRPTGAAVNPFALPAPTIVAPSSPFVALPQSGVIPSFGMPGPTAPSQGMTVVTPQQLDAALGQLRAEQQQQLHAVRAECDAKLAQLSQAFVDFLAQRGIR